MYKFHLLLLFLITSSTHTMQRLYGKAFFKNPATTLPSHKINPIALNKSYHNSDERVVFKKLSNHKIASQLNSFLMSKGFSKVSSKNEIGWRIIKEEAKDGIKHLCMSGALGVPTVGSVALMMTNPYFILPLFFPSMLMASGACYCFFVGNMQMVFVVTGFLKESVRFLSKKNKS